MPGLSIYSREEQREEAALHGPVWEDLGARPARE
jgi:hypothetical protein